MVRPRTESVRSASAPTDPGTESLTRPALAGLPVSAGAVALQPATESGRRTDWRVLFVGGDPSWFQQIAKDLSDIHAGWSCQQAAGVAEAETALQAASFEGLVVDGTVPDVSSLLNKLEAKIGRMICLVRCNVSDRTTVAQWNRSGMTPVSQDADAAALVSAMKKADFLRNWMADQTMKKLLSLIRKLPTAPRLHSQITEKLQSSEVSIDTVAQLIAQDPVMSAKILQVANSAFFSLSQEVTDTTEAVMILGTERIRSLILLAGVFSQFVNVKCPGFSPDVIWWHSLQVAMFARTIAFGETKDAKIAEAAFTAGLLHDIGKLVLAGNVPEMVDTVGRMQASKKISQREAEKLVLGVSHAELGACLLAIWGLPWPILEAIAWHHDPGKCTEEGFSLLAAVHAANVFAQECRKNNGDEAPDSISLEFLLRIGLGDCRNRWRELCGIPAKPEGNTTEDHVRQRREAKEN